MADLGETLPVRIDSTRLDDNLLKYHYNGLDGARLIPMQICTVLQMWLISADERW